jgi:L-aspartate oxidase
MMGGVETDLDGRTSVVGLFAAGEVACTGVHGANRLASNSLLEGLVFGARAADAMTTGPARAAAVRDVEQVTWQPDDRQQPASDLPGAEEVRAELWRHCGLLRERLGLEDAVGRLERCYSTIRAFRSSRGVDHEFRRLSSIVTVGLLVARAALRREESRGGHFRSDFPGHDDIHWRRHVSDALTRA